MIVCQTIWTDTRHDINRTDLNQIDTMQAMLIQSTMRYKSYNCQKTRPPWRRIEDRHKLVVKVRPTVMSWRAHDALYLQLHANPRSNAFW